jgi:hypothetical protein
MIDYQPWCRCWKESRNNLGVRSALRQQEEHTSLSCSLEWPGIMDGIGVESEWRRDSKTCRQSHMGRAETLRGTFLSWLSNWVYK